MTTAYLKFGLEHVDAIREREKTVTARVGLDREIRPGDSVELVDEDGDTFATATVDSIGTMPAKTFHETGFDGHRQYDRLGGLLEKLRRYYPDETITPSTELTVVTWSAKSLEPVFEYDDRPTYELL